MFMKPVLVVVRSGVKDALCLFSGAAAPQSVRDFAEKEWVLVKIHGAGRM